MSRLADVFGVLESLKAEEVIVDYAIAGAMAVAIIKEYDIGVSPRVVRPEHLVALAVQTGGRKRREHVARLLESEGFDMSRLDEILERHGLMNEWRERWDHA